MCFESRKISNFINFTEEILVCLFWQALNLLADFHGGRRSYGSERCSLRSNMVIYVDILWVL
jgi:hypothetical protein